VSGFNYDWYFGTWYKIVLSFLFCLIFEGITPIRGIPTGSATFIPIFLC